MVAFRRGSSSGSSMIVDGDNGSFKSKDGGGLRQMLLCGSCSGSVKSKDGLAGFVPKDRGGFEADAARGSCSMVVDGGITSRGVLTERQKIWGFCHESCVND